MIQVNERWKRDYDAIIASSPVLYSDKTILFEQIYYPVFLMEVDMEEETFEDIEAVQYYILKLLYDTGLSGTMMPEYTACALGLSPSYTSKILKLFYGYGYVAEKYGITKLGEEVLKKKQEIHRVHVKQLFYYDAINRGVMDRTHNFDKRMICEPGKVNKRAVILPCYNRVLPQESASNWFEKVDGDDFIQHNRDILHVNVRAVNDIKFVDRRFIKGYLIQNTDFETVLFYTKYYDLTKEKKEERTVWKPIAICSRQELHNLKWAYKTDKFYAASREYMTVTRKTARMLLERNQRIGEKRKQAEQRKITEKAESTKVLTDILNDILSLGYVHTSS